MPSPSTRIEDNSFPTRGVWWISHRVSNTTLWEKFLGGDFMSNPNIGWSLFVPIIRVPWQVALYGVLLELQSSIFNEAYESNKKPENDGESSLGSKHAVFRTVQQQVCLYGLSCLTLEQLKFILRPLSLSFKSLLFNKANSRSIRLHLPSQNPFLSQAIQQPETGQFLPGFGGPISPTLKWVKNMGSHFPGFLFSWLKGQSGKLESRMVEGWQSQH